SSEPPRHFPREEANRYCPEPTSIATASPYCRQSAIPLPLARAWPPSVTPATCALGSRTVARVLGGTSTDSSKRPSLSVQAELRGPYIVWWLALALVNPPP